MATYKNIPVDPETHRLALELAKRNRRGLGAQVRILIDAELDRERQAFSQLEQPMPAEQKQSETARQS